MASCSFPALFIMLSLCRTASLPATELSLSRALLVQPATHPHVWVTSCVLCSGTLQPPSSLLHCHSPNTQTPRMNGIRRYWWGSAMDGQTLPTVHLKKSILIHSSAFQSFSFKRGQMASSNQSLEVMSSWHKCHCIHYSVSDTFTRVVFAHLVMLK